MSLVTLGDRAKAMRMIGSGSARRDRLLRSLALATTWTDSQRALIDALWNARRQGTGSTGQTRSTGR